MILWLRITTLISLIFGLIHCPQGEARPLEGVFFGDGLGSIPTGALSSTFSENLYFQLISNNAFRLLFNGQLSPDLAANIGATIAQALAKEFLLPEQFTNHLVNALAYISFGAGPKDYANALANALAYILARSNLFNGFNSFQIANTVADIIISTVSMSLGMGTNFDDRFNSYDYDELSGYDTAAELGLGTGLNLGTSLNDGVKTGLGLGTGLNVGLGLGTGLNAGVGLGSGSNAGLGLGVGLNSGLGVGAGLNAGVGLGTGLNSGLGLGVGLNTGLGVGAGLNSGIGLGLKSGLGLGAGLNAGLGVGSALGANVGLGAGLKADVGLGVDLGAKNGLGLAADVGLKSGLGLGVDVGANVGVGLDLGVGVNGKGNSTLGTKEAIEVFKQKLFSELLKDKYFRSIFSESVPAAAVSGLASAIAQFLSKAFNVPRTYLLGLENDINNFVKNDLATPNDYAEGISLSLTNILTALGILSPSVIGIQISMASKAITGGILNFLGTSTVPGVGLSISNNPYNSYFSVLSGLEMLPYVGPDAVSRKYPPILKAAKASTFSTKFKKALYSNLISSSRFSEAFTLGIPATSWKTLANSLGNYVAEAFGSPNPPFFVDSYSNALLSLGIKLSYKTYAKVIAEATAKALYALGYFVSGNTNIQAAIASNAVIKALQSKSRIKGPYRAYQPTKIGLPWITPLSGVPYPANGEVESKDKEKSGIDVGLGVNAGLDVDLGLGVDIASQADLGLGLDANANIDAALGIDAGLFAGLKKRRKRSLFDVDAAIGLAADANTNIGAAVDVGAKAALGVGADIGANVNAGLGLGANVGLGLGGNVGLGLGSNVGLGVGGKEGSKYGSGTGIQLSVLDVLPQLLLDKLFSSTAMYTAMTIVGTRKVSNLIAQGIAAQFGFQTAAVFVNSYDTFLSNSPDSNFASSIIAIARATTEALAAAGILSTPFNVMTADQLATAIVAKYSSLIATSLDSKDWSTGTKWTHVYDQDFIDPPLSPGYSYFRPSFTKSLDDNLTFDYGVGNAFAVNMQLANGRFPKSRILM